MLPCTFLITLFGLHSAATPSPTSPVVLSSRPRPDLDKHFQRTEGWTGGDGVFSVALTPQKTLYLFSDTWVGKMENNKHINSTIVNNTVGIQTGNQVEFFIRRDAAGKPQALITPSEGPDWYWLFAGAMVKEKLLICLAQIEKTDEKSVFGFRSIGLKLGVVENPLDDPRQWRVAQTPVPHACFRFGMHRTFGAAMLSTAEHLYIYGTTESTQPIGRKRQLIVARAKLATAHDPGSWEFFGQGTWQNDVEKCEPIADEMASEASVIHLPHRNQYLLVYTRGGMSNEIRGRLAPNPWGPWSAPTTLYQCPETTWDKRIFCYAAKAHTTLSQDNTIIISYVANSFDFGHMANDTRLYWPRFVEVVLK